MHALDSGKCFFSVITPYMKLILFSFYSVVFTFITKVTNRWSFFSQIIFFRLRSVHCISELISIISTETSGAARRRLQASFSLRQTRLLRQFYEVWCSYKLQYNEQYFLEFFALIIENRFNINDFKKLSHNFTILQYFF